MHGLKTLEELNRKAAEVKAVKVKMAKKALKVVSLSLGGFIGVLLLVSVVFIIALS